MLYQVIYDFLVFFLTLTHLKLFYWTKNYITFDTSFSDILLHWWCHYEYISYLFLYLSFNNRILWVCTKNLCSQKVIIISCFDFYEFRISSFTKWLENIMDCTCKNNILLRDKKKNKLLNVMKKPSICKTHNLAGLFLVS